MRKKQNYIEQEKLIAYVKGELDAEHINEVLNWYDSSEKNARLLELIYITHKLSRSVEAMEKIDEDIAYEKFRRQVKAIYSEKCNVKKYRLKKYVSRIAIAAVFIAALTLSGITLLNFTARIQRPITVKTGVGERVKVELPDGSQVWINACSELSYKFKLFSSERNVSMNGEAYFEVKKDKSSPFIIDSHGVKTHVLGTRFNINANGDENTVITTLLEGSIIVSYDLMKNSQGVVMKPNQSLAIDRSNGTVQISEIMYAAESIGWVSGKLHFESMTFEEIARNLEKYYNIEVIFKDDKIRNELFSGDFSTSDNIERILTLFKKTGKFDYTITGRQVEIYSL